ncbi:DUF2281 domain-containing protein [Oceanobacillus alkalisoli]|uniref:DUF2281 domain-containing protein n=1 Tax=Oceanobacillus alkalisoli TaxID=2925113 RepID=UPI001EE4D443|nr:DUF2281 domain-containing protein [Oceanobacillus alkalisoli]MCG5104909.1 DUF2281 domain-containing protein [Oceanobacillus alkalisoli]
MNTARERLLKIIEKIPDQEVDKILDFAEYLAAKQEKRLSDDLTKVSESSLDF